METTKTLPQIRKILFATDLSENARYAFHYAISLANKYGAGITVIYVLDDPDTYGYSLAAAMVGEDEWAELRKNKEASALQELKQRVQDFCKEVSSDIPECTFITDEVIVKVGNPVEDIIREANTKGYDLVVMGARGHGALVDVTMGSVSRRVLRRSNRRS